MKQLTIKDIRNLEPCYDPTKYLPEDWTGTAIDILKMTDIPVDDRLWVVVRQEFISDKTLQYFTLACARQCEKYSTDERVKHCNDVTESYLKDEATKNELDAAAAASYAGSRAARAAYYASYVTHATIYACAAYAVDAATCSADAASYAVYAADAVAAFAPAQEEQCLLLIKLIEENEK